jgi:hypothetical protein
VRGSGQRVAKGLVPEHQPVAEIQTGRLAIQ